MPARLRERARLEPEMNRRQPSTLVAIAATAALAAGLAAGLAAAIPAGAFGGASAASTHVVTLKNVRFRPATLSIHRGDRVKWVWEDEQEHNITFHGFHSPTQERGTYTVRFTRAGTYNYRCTIHFEEGMKGKIIVH
jgi:plastocyanin